MARKKILIVDDEQIIREVFIAAFDEYAIIPATNGTEALHILSCPNNIDLVVADFMMPGLKGVELLRKIKHINPNLKVVVITGYSFKEAVIKESHPYIDEYIEKPFDINRIKEIFERLFKHKK